MKNKTILALMTGAAMVFSAQTAAFSKDEPEGKQLAQLGFEAIDRGGKGFVHMGDMEAFRAEVFISMDGDENNAISRDEFMQWDYGFIEVAAQNDAQIAYRTALKVIFALWDRDGNGALTPSEHRHAINADFRRADLDGNAILNEREFLGGFSMMVALRVALKPE